MLTLKHFLQWAHNKTDKKFRASSFTPHPGDSAFVLNIDCDGNYANCRLGTPSTRICLSQASVPWSPTPKVRPAYAQTFFRQYDI